jgi:predicted O-linked N-acetylglucosamine transferase (SPINDLY family)
LGLANSPNKLLFTLVTSPSSMYDHLIQRDPSCIWFLSLFNVTPLNLLDIMYQKKSLLNCWDCLELVKINALKYNNLQEILSKVEFELESLSLHKLRIAYWIMIINNNIKKKKFAEDTKKLSEEIEQAKLYIFLQFATNYLQQLVLQKNLNDTQILSMNLLSNYLEIWLAGEEDDDETSLSQRIKETLETINQFNLIKQEKCNLCEDIITEPWASSCSKGHLLPRCAITRLQVTCMKFRTCIICEEIFHPSLDIQMPDVRCLYCDLPAIYKNQLTNLSLKILDKNLSKKRTVITKDD